MANGHDGDTRKVDSGTLTNKKRLDDVPLAKFRSFQRSDQFWVIAGLLALLVIISVFLGDWNFG